MIRVTIPATSANLGAGFDSLGIALTHYNTVEMEEMDGADIRSMDDTVVPTGEDNLIYATARHLYEECGRPFRGLRIRQTNAIPMARGLGSSSACIVGGLLGANRLLGDPLSQQELIDMAAALEGHPDNSTPALAGGLVTSVLENGRVYYVRRELARDLDFVVMIPDFELKTSLARSALPKEIPHGDGVFNLSRAALMAASLADGQYQNLRVAAEDRLHQPYRLSLIPGAEEVFRRSYENGACAACISGAGSTLLAMVPASEPDFAGRMRRELDALGRTGWKILSLKIENRGAYTETL